MPYVIGVDPGMSGAIAVVSSDGELVAVHDMPCVSKKGVSAALLGALEDWDDERFGTVVIEDVHSMPNQGVASGFKFGESKGVVEGVFWRKPVVYVSPGTWKRHLGLTSDKGVCRQRAIELWPAHASTFMRVKDDGRAEAALIAIWHVRRAERGVA